MSNRTHCLDWQRRMQTGFTAAPAEVEQQRAAAKKRVPYSPRDGEIKARGKRAVELARAVKDALE